MAAVGALVATGAVGLAVATHSDLAQHCPERPRTGAPACAALHRLLPSVAPTRQLTCPRASAGPGAVILGDELARAVLFAGAPADPLPIAVAEQRAGPAVARVSFRTCRVSFALAVWLWVPHVLPVAHRNWVFSSSGAGACAPLLGDRLESAGPRGTGGPG